MTHSVIDELFNLAWQSTGLESFLEAVQARMPVNRAAEAVSYEFGTLEEFYQWTCRNTTPSDLEKTILKGAMPAENDRKKREPALLPHDPLKLRRECEELRESLADALAELQELVKTTVPRLENLYSASVGVLECELSAIQCENMQRKRIVELLHLHISRGLRPDIDEIRKKVGSESREWLARVEAQRRNIARAKEILAAPVDHKSGEEFRHLFRQLVRKLHPDLNPMQGEAERMLWFRLQSAYERGGPEALRDMALLTESISGSPLLPEKAGYDAWKRCRDELTTKLWDMESQIGHIRMSFPYTLNEHLTSESWINDRNRLTELKIAEETRRGESLQSSIEILERQIREM